MKVDLKPTSRENASLELIGAASCLFQKLSPTQKVRHSASVNDDKLVP